MSLSAIPHGKLKPARAAKLPSPPYPETPVPASVVTIPGLYVPVGDGVVAAVVEIDGVCVAVALTSLDELLVVAVRLLEGALLAVTVELLDGAGVPLGEGGARAARRQGSATPSDAAAAGTIV